MRLKIEKLLEIDFAEALRYSGGSEETLPDIKAAAAELLQAVDPAACAGRLPLVRSETALFCGEIRLCGNSIEKRLAGCKSAVLLALTLGFKTDRLIAASSLVSPYRALLLDSCASAAVESLADMAQRAATKELLIENERFLPRFSPGYGDLPLSLQGPLLQAINATRLIGLTVNSSLLLSPIKSVTAIIGIKEGGGSGENCRGKCGCCGLQGCPYKKA